MLKVVKEGPPRRIFHGQGQGLVFMARHVRHVQAVTYGDARCACGDALMGQSRGVEGQALLMTCTHIIMEPT